MIPILSGQDWNHVLHLRPFAGPAGGKAKPRKKKRAQQVEAADQ